MDGWMNVKIFQINPKSACAITAVLSYFGCVNAQWFFKLIYWPVSCLLGDGFEPSQHVDRIFQRDGGPHEPDDWLYRPRSPWYSAAGVSSEPHGVCGGWWGCRGQFLVGFVLQSSDLPC